ncbi:MAG: ribosome biogenesis GTP-binding protein YihA/YsxC [Pseudomonadota bacterium]
MNPYYHRARFFISAASLRQLPDAGRSVEVAFAGRSNSGKSSALNRICNRKSLARTSKSPGRTQLLNFFALDDRRHLVDLPGYGYAQVSESIRRQWQGLLADYVETRPCLRGLVLVMDIRHPLRDLDRQMLEWCEALQRPVHILLTKADKLKRGPAQQVLLETQKALGAHPGVTVQLFSALKNQGVDAAHEVLDAWLELPEQESS